MFRRPDRQRNAFDYWLSTGGVSSDQILELYIAMGRPVLCYARFRMATLFRLSFSDELLDARHRTNARLHHRPRLDQSHQN